MVSVASPTYGTILVIPGDSAGSFLYQKVTGTQGASGDSMPPSSTLTTADAEVVRVWIDTGATSDCGAPDTGSSTFHVATYEDPLLHGMDAKMQALVCVDCHGSDLNGGTSGVTCEGCHEANWRTDCTFCHGGTDNSTGAPPVDIDNQTTSLSFPEHTTHLDAATHPEWDCVECHTPPPDALSLGHLFLGDTTPGVAEVTFSAGLSSAGAYGSGCANLYCHGNGQSGSLGSVTTGETMSCHLCHADSTSTRSLSGEHSEHASDGMQCSSCHSGTVSGNASIVGPDQHVDGTINLELPSGMTYTSGSCTSTCHEENHRGEHW